MATLDLDENHAKFQIRAYSTGKIKINETVYTESVIVAPNQLITNWPVPTISALSKEALAIILELKPDILLLGTGEAAHIVPLELYGELLNQQIGVEIMTTGAACRTYNALTAENRHVVAALIVR